MDGGLGLACLRASPRRYMGSRFAGTHFFRLRMLGVVVFINLQYIFTPNDDQGPVNVHTKDFVHRHQPAAAYAAGFPILRCVIGYAPCTQLLSLAGNIDTGLTCALGDKFCRQGICAAQERSDITVSQDFLPLVIGIPVLQTCQIFKYEVHADPA